MDFTDGSSSLLGGNVVQMVTNTWDMMFETLGLQAAATGLGISLLIMMFAWTALRAAQSGRGEQLRSLFISSIIAGGIITASPTITSWVQNSWLATYAWAMEAADTVTGEASATLTHNIDEIMEDEAWWEGMMTIVTLAAPPPPGDLAEAEVEAGSRTAAAIIGGAAFRWVTRLARFILIPIVAFFIALIYISGLVVSFGALLLPIASAFLVASFGQGLVLNIFKRTIAAHASLFVIPLIFSVVLNLALINPLASAVRTLRDTVHGVAAAWAEVADTGGFWETVSSIWTGDIAIAILETLTVAFDGIFEIVAGGLMLLIGGLVASVIIAQQADNLISKFLDGITNSGRGTLQGQFSPPGERKTKDSSSGGGDGGSGGGGSTRGGAPTSDSIGTAASSGQAASASQVKPDMPSHSPSTPAPVTFGRGSSQSGGGGTSANYPDATGSFADMQPAPGAFSSTAATVAPSYATSLAPDTSFFSPGDIYAAYGGGSASA